MTDTADFAGAIGRMHARIASIRDTLNAADRVTGDGDTGMTVEQIVIAWHGAAANLPGDVGAALEALGKATMQASGSSLGAVLTMAFNAAARRLRDDARRPLARTAIVAALGAAIDSIEARSGATSGAKTVLDSLLFIRDALAVARDDDDLEATARTAARAALEALRDRPSGVGRARIRGDRVIGHDDPGMLAAVLLLDAAWPPREPARQNGPLNP